MNMNMNMNMKKVISVLMVAVALMMAAPAQAQLFKLGLKGGMNFSDLNLNAKSIGEIKGSSTGFFIGPMAEITLPIIGLGVDGALMYSQRGEDEFKKQGLEVPVNLKYSFGFGSMLGAYLAAGPGFFFNFNDIDIKDLDVKKTQVSLNLGAGLKLLKKLQVGVVYQIPMGDSFDLKAFNKMIVDTKTWQVSLAYIF